jgi:hypothetical protein
VQNRGLPPKLEGKEQAEDDDGAHDDGVSGDTSGI